MSDQSKIALSELIAMVDKIRDVAIGLTPDAVKAPDMPVMVLLDELSNTVLAAREHMDALAAVGVTVEMVERLEQYTEGLRAAQAICIAEKSRGRSDENIAQIEAAEALREDLMAAGALALRNDIEGQRRLAEIREGEGLADLVDDLRNLAVLIKDKRALFEAIHMDVDITAAEAAEKGESLQRMLSEEDVARSLVNSKEMRDRVYTLAIDALKEIRLFAAYAFRKDKSNNRRMIFTSAYMRRRNRKHRTKMAAAMGDTTGSDSATDTIDSTEI
ncbi:MAG: hypothetical protein JXR76_21270 [Deltaproteobacteria bacterium]|nr:hypothetical protein [Deltaproteobacteria bacterium]